MSSPKNKHGLREVRAAIAVLNWNGRAHLQTYLPSVVEHCADEDCVVLIDNGSTDDSLAFVRSNFPSIVVVENPDNQGFAGGYNLGLASLAKSVVSEWTVLLNSDVEVTAGWIDKVLLSMERGGWTAAQPTIRSATDRSSFEYAGASGGYIDRDGFVFCAGRLFDTYEVDAGQYPGDREVFWASGAALTIATSAWREVGGLDEDFFAHMEEIDLCWRLKNRGYKIGSTSSCVVYHLGGGTLNKSSAQKTYLNFRNNLYLLLKNQSGMVLPRLFFRLLLDGVAAVKFLTEGKPLFFWAVFRAHIRFYLMFPTMWGKRRSERRAILPRAQRNTVGRFSGSIVWQHFVRGIRHFSDLPADRFGAS